MKDIRTDSQLESGEISRASYYCSRKPIFCFSHLRWDFVYQRPQHLLTRAAHSHRVFYVEEPLFEAEGSSAFLEISSKQTNLDLVVPHIPQGLSKEALQQTLDRLMDNLVSNTRDPSGIFWYYTPLALPATRNLPRDVCVYDNMDELSAFRGASSDLLALEAELFSLADVVFTGGHSLFEAKCARHSNIHPFPSSIDTAHFVSARTNALDPNDQSEIPFPRIGFFGVIDERIDLDLITRIADLRSDAHLIMIGPTAKIDPSTLPRRRNIHWLGTKSYSELPRYLAGWNVGFMPFAINEATRFISPTKTPEFLAAGVPIVSTPIADVIRPYGEQGLVEIASGAEEFVNAIEILLSRSRQPWLSKVDFTLSEDSWDQTWAAMHALVARASYLKATGAKSQAPARIENSNV